MKCSTFVTFLSLIITFGLAFMFASTSDWITNEPVRYIVCFFVGAFLGFHNSDMRQLLIELFKCEDS